MSRRFFLYDKNIFFSEGVRSLVDDLAAHDGDCAFSRLDQFSQLVYCTRSAASSTSVVQGIS